MCMRVPLQPTYRFELLDALRWLWEKYKFSRNDLGLISSLMRDMKWILKLNVHLLLGPDLKRKTFRIAFRYWACILRTSVEAFLCQRLNMVEFCWIEEFRCWKARKSPNKNSANVKITPSLIINVFLQHHLLLNLKSTLLRHTRSRLTSDDKL